ncbi:MAG: hypothetical protein J6Y08_02325 [Clostridiales bacterium]|nr:hypothetical protein [Clostridiales bacterium]
MCGYVGLKISDDYSKARCISVIRKIEPSLSVADINSRISNDEYVLSYDYKDESGLRKIIECYEALSRSGVYSTLFNHDGECDIELLKKLNGMHDEVGDEMDAYFANECEDNKIFEYKLTDAWKIPIVSLSIYDRPEENVKCLVWYGIVAPKDLQLTKKYTIDESALKQIKVVIDDNRELLEMDEVEFPPVLDGYGNEFYFKLGDESKLIDASNISFWTSNHRTFEGEKPVNAKLVLKVHKKIKAILVDNGIDRRYMRLAWQ